MALAAANNAPGICIEDGKVLRSTRLKGIVKAVFSIASSGGIGVVRAVGGSSTRLDPSMCGVAKEHAQEMASTGSILVVGVIGIPALKTTMPHSLHDTAATAAVVVVAVVAIVALGTSSAAVRRTRVHDGQIVHELDVALLTVDLRAKLLGEPFHDRQRAVLPCT